MKKDAFGNKDRSHVRTGIYIAGASTERDFALLARANRENARFAQTELGRRHYEEKAEIFQAKAGRETA